MKVAVIGATGFVGSALLREVLNRGHEVSAIVRNSGALPSHEKLTACSLDVENGSALSDAIKGHDAVLSAYNPLSKEADGSVNGVTVFTSIVDSVKKSGVKRVLVVGGAGSLELTPGLRLVDTPDFPKEWKRGALLTAEILDVLKAEKELEWSFVSPSADLFPGERTGTFRLGGDELLVDKDGKSRISLEDFALAFVDELEKPEHTNKRFTVGY